MLLRQFKTKEKHGNKLVVDLVKDKTHTIFLWSCRAYEIVTLKKVNQRRVKLYNVLGPSNQLYQLQYNI